MNFNTVEIMSTIILGIVSSIVATFIYDNWIRNKANEPAYIFNNENDEINNIYHLSNREMNRRRIYKIFISIFSIYLIWASLYLPLVMKAGIFSNDLLDLKNTNLANYLKLFGIMDISFLVLSLEKTKWICVIIGIFLYLPCMYIQSQISLIFVRIKNKFYKIDFKDWDIYRFYGLLIFVGILLIINIHLITLLSLVYSSLIAIIVILAIIIKANEK